MPEARAAAQERLLSFIQSNRLLLLVGMAAAVWYARGTDWRLDLPATRGRRRHRVRPAPGHESGDRRGEYQVGSRPRPRLDRAVALLRLGGG